MNTSNIELLSEIDALEDLKRVDANDLECVKVIEKLTKDAEVLRSALEYVVAAEHNRGGRLHADGCFYYLTSETVFSNAEKALSATEPSN